MSIQNSETFTGVPRHAGGFNGIDPSYFLMACPLAQWQTEEGTAI